ncbi:F-box protein At4g22280-like [Carex rostrata]
MTNIDRCGREKNFGIDRMSSLPDDVRTHILSFLTTREAVQTCILSKRWIKTWASVPDLKFDIEEFGLVDINDDEMAIEFVNKFELLVKSVLEKRETTCVNRFRLWLVSQVYWPHTQAVAKYIGDVMKLEPRECSVKLGLRENLNLNTDLIFSCASLIYLQLCLYKRPSYSVAIEPNSMNLPCLKTLNLCGVTMSDDSFKKLLLGCPVLEDLRLEGCYIGIIEICSNSLKKLEIYSVNDGMKLQISTPNLLYLDISVMDMGEIMLLNMPSLVYASIFLLGWYDQDKYVIRGPKLIHDLSNVESLQLHFRCLEGQVKKKDFSSCPIFNNLKRLELVTWSFYVFDLVPYFLHHSPKLEELILENKHARGTLDEEPRDAFVQREFLKTVRIVGFGNDNRFFYKLINKLLAHVKIIGEIIF